MSTYLDILVTLNKDWIISAVLKYINFPMTERHLCRTGPLTLEPYICIKGKPMASIKPKTHKEAMEQLIRTSFQLTNL